MATEHNPSKIVADNDVCTGFDMFKVKVPIHFLGTAGFSARRDGRYPGLCGLNYPQTVQHALNVLSSED